MKISVNEKKCVGCGACEAMYPKHFRVVDGKSSVINSELEDGEDPGETEGLCGAEAISVSK